MTIGSDTITIYKGEDVILPFAHQVGEEITGWAIAFTVRGGAGPVILKTESDGITIVQGSSPATYTISIDDTDTDNLAPGVYSYDVWRTDEGSEHVMAIGSLTLLAVARATT